MKAPCSSAPGAACLPRGMGEISGDPAIALGEVVGGKYRLGRMIGRGGMSVVYEARHVQLGQQLAVKVLTGLAAGGRNGFERVLAEAQATARLTSEHVVRVVDVGATASGDAYVVMERLAGHDLAHAIRQGGAIQPSEAVRLVLEACHGLAEAHAAGIVHRDIKPSNLFLAEKADKTVTLKVLDFGLARAESTVATTARGSARGPRIAGSPGYASPEQLGTAADVDARADVWGLGVVLYELVSGQRPFDAANLQDALIAAATRTMPPLVARDGSALPPGFDAVVRRCLEKDRENRFASVQDLAEALRPYAPPAFAHYVDRVRAVAGRSPLSLGTIRVGGNDGNAATISSFATDTLSGDAPVSSAAPESMLLPSASDAEPAKGFVVASILTTQRIAIIGALIVLVLAAGVVAIVLLPRRVAPVTPARPAPSSPVSPVASGLGPLPPLVGAPASEPPPSVDPVPLASAAKPKGPRPKPVTSAKPAGNPMNYR